MTSMIPYSNISYFINIAIDIVFLEIHAYWDTFPIFSVNIKNPTFICQIATYYGDFSPVTRKNRTVTHPHRYPEKDIV